MRHTRTKFSIDNASPGLESTERYGTGKYSFRKNKELEKLFNEFMKLHINRKLKNNDTATIRGRKRTWTVKKAASATIRGRKRTWTVKNKARSR